MRQTLIPRALGLATLGYGVYTLGRPGSVVRAAGLEPDAPAVSASGRVLGSVIGARDLLSGLAILTAPAGGPLVAAVAARVACDASDVIGFGVAAPRASRAKVTMVAGAWGLLCGGSIVFAGGRR
ncbi:MAG TPA: hypothetical protein VF468_13680 [Actinomycetota bacterium]|nr:hypothetical protein [Actinomycetota bacterium]